MAYLRDHVVILKKEIYREQDRRYALYGRKFGLMWAVARGSLRPRSKQSGQLEPLGFAEVMIAKGRAYDHLAVATGARPQMRIRALGGLIVAGAFADICLSVLRPGLADSRIFLLWEELNRMLSALPAEPSPARASLLFSAANLRLLDVMGYGPVLETCLTCKTDQEQDWLYAPEWNGIVCFTCGKGMDRTIPISAETRTVLRLMRQGQLQDVLRVTMDRETIRWIEILIRSFLEHTPLEREPHGWKTIQGILG